jgi:hypothetical protein
VFDLPPGHEAPPAVVVEYDAAAVNAQPNDWTRSIRDQIAAAFSAGSIPDLDQKLEGGGGGVIVPPKERMMPGDPVIVPPPGGN